MDHPFLLSALLLYTVLLFEDLLSADGLLPLHCPLLLVLTVQVVLPYVF